MTDITGPGILFVEARISRPDILTESTYMDWYDNDHIAEIIQTSGVDSAFRYICPGKDYPYLAMYELRDIAFTQSAEFRNIRVHSNILPGSKLVYDLADNNVRYYKLTGVFDPTKRGPGQTKSIIVAQTELRRQPGGSVPESVSDEELEKWHHEHRGPVERLVPGYLRTTRFKLVYARSNAQSRVLKGLPVTSDEPQPSPPLWLALHEFDTENIDLEVVARAYDTKKDRNPTTGFSSYKMAKTHGNGEWFHSIGTH